MQGQADLVLIRAGEVRDGLTVADALLVDKVHALARPLDQPAAGEDFGDAAISGLLPVEDVLEGDPHGQTAGAVDLQPPGELSEEDAPSELIVAVADGVQDGLADGALVERGDGGDEKPLLEVLLVVAEVDPLPKLVVEGEEPPPVLLAVLRRPRSVGGSILEHHFGKGQEPAQRLRGAEEDQSRVGHLTIDDGFGIGQQFRAGHRGQFVGERCILDLADFLDPSPAEVLDGGGIQIVEFRERAYVGGKVAAALREDFSQLVLGQGGQAVLIPRPIDAFVLDRRGDGTAGHREHQDPAAGGAVGVVDLLEIDA